MENKVTDTYFPRNVLSEIMSELSIEDIGTFSILSKTGKEIYEDNHTWYLAYNKYIGSSDLFDHNINYKNLYYYTLFINEFLEEKYDGKSDYYSRYYSMSQFIKDNIPRNLDHLQFLEKKGTKFQQNINKILTVDNPKLLEEYFSYKGTDIRSGSPKSRKNRTNIIFNAYILNARNIVEYLKKEGIILNKSYQIAHFGQSIRKFAKLIEPRLNINLSYLKQGYATIGSVSLLLLEWNRPNIVGRKGVNWDFEIIYQTDEIMNDAFNDFFVDQNTDPQHLTSEDLIDIVKKELYIPEDLVSLPNGPEIVAELNNFQTIRGCIQQYLRIKNKFER